MQNLQCRNSAGAAITWESYHTIVTYHIISESVHHTGKQGMSCLFLSYFHWAVMMESVSGLRF